MVAATKAYKNPDFINSREARNVRIMCEITHPQIELSKQNVENVIMFFGSARISETHPLAESYGLVKDLAYQLSLWAQKHHKEVGSSYAVGTGGGPGLMCAANEGAQLAGAPSIGFGISLPFEKHLNPYVSKELAFEFHYFFTRKFAMAYRLGGLVIAPGGLGTLDELFEILTLKQTGKIKKDIPVVLLGSSFWRTAINWQFFVDQQVVSEKDINSLCFAETVTEALDFLSSRLVCNETSG